MESLRGGMLPAGFASEWARSTRHRWGDRNFEAGFGENELSASARNAEAAFHCSQSPKRLDSRETPKKSRQPQRNLVAT